MAARPPSVSGFNLIAVLAVTLALAVVLAPLAALAQKSPFGVPPPDAAQRVSPLGPAAPGPGAVEAPAPTPGFWTWVQRTQRELHRGLAAAMQRLKAGDGFAAVWLLAGLSFVYGVIHAVGPGHGKAVISSYVLANERTVARGVALCFVAAIVQALSAVLLVAVLAAMLNAAGLRIKQTAGQLETASYALIIAVGAWLLFAQARRLWRRRPSRAAAPRRQHVHAHAAPAHDHASCRHAHMPDPTALERAANWKEAAAIILAVGLRPCTGAILVLVFAFANGLFLAGVGATFAMALGTAITVSVLAALAVGSRDLAVRLAGPGTLWADRIAGAVAIGGAMLVLALGIVLFAGSLGPAPPF